MKGGVRAGDPSEEWQAARVTGSLWAIRPFRLLVIGQVVTNIGNGLAPLALAFGVADIGGGAAGVGLVASAYGFAFAATLLVGGVAGDLATRRSMIMVSSSAVRVVIQGTTAVLLFVHSALPSLAICAALNGVATGMSVPSSRSMTQETVPRNLLARAVKVRSLSQETARICGVAAAGVLTSALGAPGVLALDAASFIVAAVLFAGIREDHGVATGRDGHRASIAFLARGFAEVLRSRWLLIVTVQAMVFHLAWGGVEDVLGPAELAELVGRGVWSLVMAMVGVGAVIGGMVSMRLAFRRPMVVGFACLAGTALLPAALMISTNVVVLCGAGIMFGVLLQVYGIALDTAIQFNVSTSALARVYSVEQFFSVFSRPLGASLVASVGAFFEPHAWLAGVVTLMLCSALLALAAPSVRRVAVREEGVHAS